MKKRAMYIICIISLIVLSIFTNLGDANIYDILEVQDNLMQEDQVEKEEKEIETESKEVIKVAEATNNLNEIYLEYGIVNKETKVYDTQDKKNVVDYLKEKEVISIVEINEDMYKVYTSKEMLGFVEKINIDLKPIVMYANTDTPVMDKDEEFMNILIKEASDVEVIGKVKDKYKVKVQDKEGYVYQSNLECKEIKVGKKAH